MATAYVASSGDHIRPYRNVRLKHFKEAASQTFRVGDPLILQTTADKGDQVKIAGSDPTTGTVVGFAAEVATGTEDTLVAVWVLDYQSEFLVIVQDASTLDRDQVGDEYGIVADATNLIYRLDTTETTSKVFRVTDLAPGYGHGDTNGKLVVKSAYGAGAIYGS
jgi:hypothetical protein